MDTRKRKAIESEDSPAPKKPRLVRSNAVLGISVFPPPPKPKTRSQKMAAQLDELPHISADKTHFKHYRIVTHELIDFTEPFASIGADLNSTREIVEVDPESETINTIYDAILKFSPNPSLEVVATIINKWFAKYHGEELATKTDELIKRWMKQHGHEPNVSVTTKTAKIIIPTIPLDYFLRHNVCACRHHAMITAIILDALIQDNKLFGVTHIHRDTVDGIAKGAHSFNIFQTIQDDEEYVYFIDTLNFNRPLELSADRALLVKHFGEKVITQLEELYLPPTAPVNDEKEISSVNYGFKLS